MLLEKLEGQNIAQISILLILTPLPLLYFADSNTDWSDVMSKPISIGYLFVCWFFGYGGYISKKINTTQIQVPIKAFLKNVYTTQKQVPIKAFLIAIGITSFIGFSTYHDFFSSTDDYYEDGYADDPYPDDARIWRLQSKIDNLYSSVEDPLVDGEEIDQIRTLKKQIEQIIVNKRHDQAVANYIFYTLSIYVGLLLGRGGEFEKSNFFGFFRKLYNHIKNDRKMEDEKPHKPTLHFKFSENWKNLL